MKSGITLALALLVFAAAAVFAVARPSAGELGPATASKPLASFPAIGIPFVSGSFVGTIEIKGFLAQGGKIVADAVIRNGGRKATPARLPVRITQSTCYMLELRVGPPQGAVLPMVITQHQGNSDLNTSEFCDIAQANGVPAQVSALNEGGNLGAGPKSCSWIQALGCVAAAASCASSCLAGPEVCILCFAAVGAPACYDCF